MLSQRAPARAWFWTPEWQAGEREEEADKIARRTMRHGSGEAFEAALRAREPDLADAGGARRDLATVPPTDARSVCQFRLIARSPLLHIVHIRRMLRETKAT